MPEAPDTFTKEEALEDGANVREDPPRPQQLRHPTGTYQQIDNTMLQYTK